MDVFSISTTDIIRGEYDRKFPISFVSEKNVGLTSVLVFLSIIIGILLKKFLIKPNINIQLDLFFSAIICLAAISLFYFLVYVKNKEFHYYLPIVFLGLWEVVPVFLTIIISSFHPFPSYFLFLFKDGNALLQSEKNWIITYYLTAVFKFICAIIFLFAAYNHWKKMLENFMIEPWRITIFLLLIGFNFLVFVYPQFNKESLLSSTTSNENSIKEIFLLGSTWFQVFLLIEVVVIVPLFEEAIFRFAALNIFGKKNALIAMAVSVVWFGVFHIQPTDFDGFSQLNFADKKQKILTLLNYFETGFLLCLFFFYGRFCLIYPIIYHFYLNLTVSSLIYIPLMN